MKQEIKIQLIQYTDETQDEICGLLVRKGFEVKLREVDGVKAILWCEQKDMFNNRIVHMGQWLIEDKYNDLYFRILGENSQIDFDGFISAHLNI